MLQRDREKEWRSEGAEGTDSPERHSGKSGKNWVIPEKWG